MPITKATASSIAPAAKGDLVVGSATNDAAILAVGATNGHTLQVDSAEATGMKWAAAATGGLTLLSTTSFTSGSSVAITSISGSYKHLLVIGRNLTCSTNTDYTIQFNNDSTSIYSNARFSLVGSTVSATISTDGGFQPSAIGSSNTNSAAAAFVLEIYRYAESSEHKVCKYRAKGVSSTNVHRDGFVTYGSNTAISQINFVLDGGTFASGTVYVYGVS